MEQEEQAPIKSAIAVEDHTRAEQSMPEHPVWTPGVYTPVHCQEYPISRHLAGDCYQR